MPGEGKKETYQQPPSANHISRNACRQSRGKLARHECTSIAGGIMGPIILCNTLSRAREHASMYDDSQNAIALFYHPDQVPAAVCVSSSRRPSAFLSTTFVGGESVLSELTWSEMHKAIPPISNPEEPISIATYGAIELGVAGTSDSFNTRLFAATMSDIIGIA